jgi:hypothetical protein
MRALTSTTWSFAVGLLVLPVIGCVAANDALPTAVEAETSLTPDQGWQMYRDRAKAAGGDSGLYIVEGDMTFHSEAELHAFYDHEMEYEASKLAVIKHAFSPYEEATFTGTNALHIKYCVSGVNINDKSARVADMKNATADWEAVANVRFIYDSSYDGSCDSNTSQVDFAVLYDGAPGAGGCGQNKLFWTGASNFCPTLAGGKGVLVLGQYSNIQTGGHTMRGLMRHELGHILGFRHEHPWAQNPGGGVCSEQQVFGTGGAGPDIGYRRLTPYDQKSVMHYWFCDGDPSSDYEITQQDGIGTRSIYGMPVSWYVGASII